MSTNDLYSHFDVLVDSMSDFAVSAVTGDFTKDKLKQITSSIAQTSQKVIAICQAVATKTNDKQHQSDIIEAMNLLAAAIKGIVGSFSKLMQSRDSKDAKLAFASSTKDLGDAISLLIEATDETSEAQILRIVRLAIDASKALSKASAPGGDKAAFLRSMQDIKERVAKLRNTCQRAAMMTANMARKNLFLKADELLPGDTEALQGACRAYYGGKGKADAVQQTVLKLSETFKLVVRAAKMPSGLATRVSELYEYLRSLIEKLKDLQRMAAELFAHARDHDESPQQIKFRGDELDKLLKSLLKDARKIHDLTDDPEKKQRIRDAMRELQDAGDALRAAANAAVANPNDATAQKRLALAHARMEAAIGALLESTGGDASLATARGKLAASAASIEEVSKHVCDMARTGDPKRLIPEAKALHALGAQYERDARLVAMGMGDKQAAAAVEQGAGEVRALCSDLIKASKATVQAPKDREAGQRMDRIRDRLLAKLAEVGKLTDTAAGQGGGDGWPDLDIKPGDSDLVRATKAQIRQAKQLAQEADLMCESLDDRKRVVQIRDCCDKIKGDSHEVLDRVYEYSDDLNNERKAAAFQAAQQQLAKDVNQLVGLTTTGSAEVTSAMGDLTGAANEKAQDEKLDGTGEALALCDDLLAQLFQLLGHAANLSGEDLLNYAKNVAEMVKRLAAELNKLAEQVSDPDMKQQLIMGGKIAKDKALQLKIVAAVQASGDSGINNVGEVAKNLQEEVKSIVTTVREAGIKAKAASTKKQAAAIENLVKVWRRDNIFSKV